MILDIPVIDWNVHARNILCIVSVKIFEGVIGFSKHSGSNCERSSSIAKGLEGPTKTRVLWSLGRISITLVRQLGVNGGGRIARGSGKG